MQDGTDAAGAVNVFHVPLAGGADLAEMRGARGYLVDALEGVIDTGLARQGQGVQHGVG